MGVGVGGWGGGSSKYLVTTEDIESDIHLKKRNTYGCFTNLQKESMGIQDLDSHVYQSHSTILQTATYPEIITQTATFSEILTQTASLLQIITNCIITADYNKLQHYHRL